LADRAGVSRRTLYLHFASKEEIAAETVAKNMLRRSEQMLAILPDAAPLPRLKAVLRWFVDRGAEPRPIPVGPIKAEPGLMETIRTFPSYQAAHTQLMSGLSELIARAQEIGSITRRFSPEILAKLLFQLLRGVDASRWEESTSLPDAMMSLLFDGLGGQP
jgi:AcrR family transcriptional regulator